jgi:ubiquinone/menaquinone biosynthesis C-methylase UbiE
MISGAKALWFDGWRRYQRVLERRNTHVVGAVERPLPGQPFVHVVEVSGWAHARDGSPADIQIAAGGRIVAEIEASGARFQSLIRASLLPPRKICWLTVTARRAGDRSAAYERIASLPIVRLKKVPRSLPRQAYGAVWDRVSHSFEAAQIAVAGSADAAEWERSGESTADYIRRMTGLNASDVVLEIGCGAGRVGRHLAPLCKQWIGCDVSSNMLRHAARALANASNVSLQPLNGYDLDGLPDRSVDLVYCNAVFMHLDEWDRFRYVKEAFRILRPGGRVFYNNFDLLSEQGWTIFEEMERLDPAMRRPHASKSSTPQELQRFAEKAGFVDITLDAGLLLVAVIARKPADS